MTCRHDSRASVHHGTEEITSARLDDTAMDPHAHTQRLDVDTRAFGAQRELVLEVECRAHGIGDGFEGGDGTVARPVDQRAVMTADDLGDEQVMIAQESVHRLGIGVPPLGRALDVGEQKGPFDEQVKRRLGSAFSHTRTVPPAVGFV